MDNNKHTFVIPQVEENNENNTMQKKQKQRRKVDAFVSPIYGTKVKDTNYYPSIGYNNKGRQYDSFRDPDARVRKEDYSDYAIKNPYIDNNNEANKVQNNQDASNTGFRAKDDAESSKNIIYTEVNQDIYAQESNNYQQRESNQCASSVSKENLQSTGRYDDQYSENQNSNDVIDINRGDVLQAQKKDKKSIYKFPPLSLLKRSTIKTEDNYEGVKKQEEIINNTLNNFDIDGRVVKYTKGPTVTLFEIQLAPGVKYQKVPAIQYNLQGNLEALSIRIQAPIPGKGTVGIEVPNIGRDIVYFGDMITNESFLKDGNPLNVVLGMDITGCPVYVDISKMPHGLIAGSTGSGKSVCINSIIASILYKAHPDDVKLILIDPKKVEFSKFRGVPHLATPIITDNKLASGILRWCVDEMESRYELFSSVGASNYREYLQITKATKDVKHMPYFVIIIDELADLMVSGADVEESIMRITAKARACGMYLLVCTQRPSVNVINGVIKTNIPCRIAFKVNKAIDSNIILDRSGAEKLLGKGDMLYDEENGRQRRIQGAFISGPEIVQVVSYIEHNYNTEFMFTKEDINKKIDLSNTINAMDDELFEQIARYVVENQTASINRLQKAFGCGFNRIQAIIEKLEELGIVSENLGSRAREVLVHSDELEDIINGY